MNWDKIESILMAIIIAVGIPLGTYLLVWDILRHMR